MLELSVDVARSDHRYDILIGGFLSGAWLDIVEQRVPAKKYLAVVDSRVAELHAIGQAAAERPAWQVVHSEAGEGRKGLSEYAALCECLLSKGIDRQSVVVAIGGGVTGDIAGFAAATLLRGIRHVQIPTTLLAQVDSSIGGKTGLNLAGGKNLLGAFYQPELVLIDPAFLVTLSQREYLAGLAEMIKYGVIADRKFFDRLDAKAVDISRRDAEALEDAVAHCCRMKADIVGADERESGQRGLLNFGHTFGHALEALSSCDGTVLHGEAVSAGMAMAADFAVQRGMAEPAEAKLLKDGLARHGLPAGRIDLDRLADRRMNWSEAMCPDAIKAALAHDKKVASTGLTLVLPRTVGDCRLVKGVPVAEVAEFMSEWAR
ncbi:MAG: 3-dehydroquinate synthase [Planctomycetes bacterium]|nr:3-dehydroquinate synthase [Planctomycetota bacterium]